MKEKKKRKTLMDKISLDWIGFSYDYVGTDGQSGRRSFGATIMFFAMALIAYLTFSVSTSIIVDSFSKLKNPAVVSKTRRRSANAGNNAKQGIKIGWPTVALHLGVLGIGAYFSIIRRKQDWQRTVEAAKIGIELKHGKVTESAVPSLDKLPSTERTEEEELKELQVEVDTSA